MNTYIVLLRGINVGGKNAVSMADLKKHLQKIGFSNVVTYIASGNVILQSDKSTHDIKVQIEALLLTAFTLQDKIKVLVLSFSRLQAIVDNPPQAFGTQPERYHSDVIFMIDIDAHDAMHIFNPRDGVDVIWTKNDVIYSQRLSAMRAKSRLGKITLSPLYKSMTIRSWRTTCRLFEIAREVNSHPH